MRILYYFPEEDSPMFHWQRFHFIDELSHYGIEFDIFNPLLYESQELAFEKIKEIINNNYFDLFFTSSTLLLSIELLSEIRLKGLPTLCFRPDNLLIPYIDKEIISHFDLVWLTSPETIYLYEKWHANIIFMPYAANPFRFYPSSDKIISKVCFIGTPYGSRVNTINSLISNGIELDVYCKNTNEIKELPRKSELLFKPKTLSIIESISNYLRFKQGRKVLLSSVLNKFNQQSKLMEEPNLSIFPKLSFEDIKRKNSEYCLSLSSTSARNTDILVNPVPVVNLRAFEIPMCGGLQFCRFNQELAKYYHEDKEIVFYRTIEEMVEKADYYTRFSSQEQVRTMKRAARKRSEEEHTWYLRFSKAFDLLGLKY